MHLATALQHPEDTRQEQKEAHRWAGPIILWATLAGDWGETIIAIVHTAGAL